MDYEGQDEKVPRGMETGEKKGKFAEEKKMGKGGEKVQLERKKKNEDNDKRNTLLKEV